MLTITSIFLSINTKQKYNIVTKHLSIKECKNGSGKIDSDYLD